MRINASNISGIADGSAEITPGVNTIQASNWQGKSSLVDALAAAFGVRTPLTEGKPQGTARLELDGETYEVTLERDGTTVERRGNPVVDEEYHRIAAALFAFLDEDNDVRRAVRNGEDLKGVLTRPLDVEDIDQQIRELSREKESVETELRRANEKADALVSLRQRRNEIERELEDLRDRKAAFDDGTVSETREELSDLRAERDRVTDLIERLERTLERLQEKLASAYDEYEEIEVSDPEGIEDELVDIREDYERVREDKELLQSIYTANKQVLERDRLELLSEVDRSLVGDTHTCWLCGGEASTEEFESHIEEIGDRVIELRQEVKEYEERIGELEQRRDEIRDQRRREADLEAQVEEVEEAITKREENLSSAKDRLESVERRIAELQTEAEDVDEEISEIRSEIKYKKAKIEDIAAEIDESEAATKRVEKLKEQRSRIADEIQQLRTRKETVETRIRTAFDEAITSTISKFETGFESARLTSEFELIVARDGREVEMDALSEGEVELLGLVTALAGFEAYSVGEVTPLVAVDQLGGLSDDNLATLSEFLEDRARFLVLTTYPENTPFGSNTIDPAEWKMVRQASAPT